ncbi:shwachman-Bodian-diamond syndrome protein, partial [Piedraia hortae CBS 480.64]
MTRGKSNITKVHWKGEADDFVILVESGEAVKAWRKDRSTPMAQVVRGFKIFCTHKQGNQGVLDAASDSLLENEFGTKNQDKVIEQMLEKGTIIETEGAERQGEKNIVDGGKVGH